MRRLHPAEQQGLTLPEILIGLVVLGVLAGLGIPNMLASFNRNNVKVGFSTVQAAIQDAQRQAMRRGQQCTIQFGKTNASSAYFDRLLATPVGCFTSGNNIQVVTISSVTYQAIDLPTGVKFATNFAATPPSVNFSFKGHIANYSSLANASTGVPTIVVFPVNGNSDTLLTASNQPRRCLMVASMLGLSRAGNYASISSSSDLAATAIDSAKCTPRLDGQS